MKVVTSTPESDTDLAARFTLEAEPLLAMLSRGARRLTHSTPTPRIYCKTP